MSAEAVRRLAAALQPSPAGTRTWRGGDDHFELPNPYGGRLLGQAVAAAAQGLEPGRSLSALHANFLCSGRRELAIDYRVQVLRDGGRLSNRRVDAHQDGALLFTALCSFHTSPPNVDRQAAQAPPSGAPAQWPGPAQCWSQLRPVQRWAGRDEHPMNAFELRFVSDAHSDQHPRGGALRRQLWARHRGPITGPASDALFAWFSDFFLLPTALKALDWAIDDPRLRIASHDHSLWLHRPLAIDDWLLFDYRFTIAAHSRAHTDAQVFDRRGALLASLAQEGLLQRGD